MIWDIRKYTDYRINPPAADKGGPVKSLLFVQVDPAGRAGEGFRFPIYGGHIVTDIWGQDVFEDPDLHPFRFRYEINSARIDIRPNTLSSKWEDWEEMVMRQSLVPFHGSGHDDATAEVKKIIRAKVTANGEFGASLRWNIQARSLNTVWVVLQCLPRSAGFLRKDLRLCTDHCGAIELLAVKLDIPCNPERPCAGPIPVIFSRDEEKTRAELTDNPALLHPG
jgi:hypothetical protein